MKKGLVLMLGLVIVAAPVFADNFSNNFATVINQTTIDALAKDIGAVVGGSSFHTGKALGFPLGFDVGVHVDAIGVQDEDAILKDDDSKLIGKWVQAEVGIPFSLNIIGRYGQIEDADAIGGGLRWGILNPSVPGMPALSITGLYTGTDHDLFQANTLSANAVVSIEIPFVHPYLGVGWDHTKIDVKDNSTLPAGASDLNSSSDGTRVEIGVNLSLIPFTYINLGGGIANGQELYHAGLGVKF